MLLLILSFWLVSASQAQTTRVNAKGVYKEIDIARHNQAIDALNGKDQNLKQKTLETILNKPNSFNPPVLYVLSRELFNQGKKEQAAFWFYTAQLRARYDANLCLDNSANQAVTALNNRFGPEINRYGFEDKENLEKIVKGVVVFFKANPEDYDHRWINLHGMRSIMALDNDRTTSEQLSQPRSQWAEIRKKTVDDYYHDFMEYAIKSRK